MKRKVIDTLVGLAYGIIVCALITFCTSCKHTEYVPMPEYHDVFINKADTLVKNDSVYLHDSIFVLKNGDTLTIEKWHTKYVDKLVYKNHIDTVIKTDSITSIIHVEKNYSALHTFTFNVGILAILILVLGFIMFIVKRYLKI